MFVVILFIIDLIRKTMEYYGGSAGGGANKYTLDDLNQATGVSSSTKTSDMTGYNQLQRDPSNRQMSSAANMMMSNLQNSMSSQMKERLAK